MWSDIDVLVIADRLPSSPLERAAALAAAPRVSPLAWTPHEFAEQLAARNPIAQEALRVGVLISGAPLTEITD